jgi:hypothetical protein
MSVNTNIEEPRAEEERGLELARAFAQRRTRHPFQPAAWIGSDGLIPFMALYILGLVIAASVLSFILGAVILMVGVIWAIMGGAMGPEAGSETAGIVGGGCGLIVGVIALNRVVIWLMMKVLPESTEPRSGMPYWAAELFEGSTRWTEARREILLTGQTGESIAAALIAERKEWVGRLSFATHGLTTILLLLVTSMYWNSWGILIPMALVWWASASILSRLAIHEQISLNPTLAVDKILRGWLAPTRGWRYFAASIVISSAVLLYLLAGICFATPLMAVAAITLDKTTWMTTDILMAIASIHAIGILIFVAHSLHHKEPALIVPLPRAATRHVNPAFDHFAAGEILRDADAIKTCPPPSLPMRTAWSGVSDLFFDVLLGTKRRRR